MKPITQQEITDYVEVNVQSFHQKRLDSLQKLKLMDVVKRKNPYLFKAKNVNTASEFVMTILDAFLSSQEEGIFGGFLEEYAKVVNKFTKLQNYGTISGKLNESSGQMHHRRMSPLLMVAATEEIGSQIRVII